MCKSAFTTLFSPHFLPGFLSSPFSLPNQTVENNIFHIIFLSLFSILLVFIPNKHSPKDEDKFQIGNCWAITLCMSDRSDRFAFDGPRRNETGWWSASQDQNNTSWCKTFVSKFPLRITPFAFAFAFMSTPLGFIYYYLFWCDTFFLFQCCF